MHTNVRRGRFDNVRVCCVRCGNINAHIVVEITPVEIFHWFACTLSCKFQFLDFTIDWTRTSLLGVRWFLNTYGLSLEDI